MSCITNITKALAFDCESGSNGFSRAMILNRSQIDAITLSTPGDITALTFVGANTAYAVDTVKRSFVASETLRVNDTAPNGLTQSVTVNLFTKTQFVPLMSSLMNGSFVVITESITAAGKSYKVFGTKYGLHANSSTYGSHDNGGYTQVTVSTPEGVEGEMPMSITAELFDTLYAASVK